MLVNVPETHDVISHEDISPPLFKNKFLDSFSRVSWFVPMLLYIPVIIYCLYKAFTATYLSGLQIFLYFLLGLGVWTSVEYFFHRFIFHYEAKSKLGNIFFYLIHGIHHVYPGDSKRLVLPPAMSIPLAFGFYVIFSRLLGDIHYAFFSGFILGYVLYDTMHYAMHHFHFIKNQWFLKMKKHHMRHHFADPEAGFGVSSDVWDKVLKTNFSKKNVN